MTPFIPPIIPLFALSNYAHRRIAPYVIFSRSLWIVVFAVLAAGCAQVKQPTVTQAPSSGPSRSAALQQELAQREQYGAVRVLKRKVAIARFSNETNYGRSFLIDENYDPIGKQALDILSAKLQQTGAFILLERADLDKINAELSLGDKGKLQNVADYLILGSVTEFGRRTEGATGVFSRTKKQAAHASVSIRLVDIYTGAIVYAGEGSGEAFSEVGTTLGVGSQASYDSTLNDKAIDAAISNLASDVIENLLEKRWRSYILAEEDGSYIIGGGPNQGLKIGDQFAVLRKGKVVKNPQTGIDVMLPSTPMATIEVTAFAGEGALSEIALTRLVDGTIPAAGDFSPYLVEEKRIDQARL